MRRALYLLLMSVAALMSCTTTRQPDFNAQEPAVIDGVRYRSPGQADMLRNAFNSFRL